MKKRLIRATLDTALFPGMDERTWPHQSFAEYSDGAPSQRRKHTYRDDSQDDTRAG